MNRLHLTFLLASVEPEDSAQTRSTRHVTFERPPNPLDRAEPPKRTRGDDDEDSALHSADHHDLEKVSEKIDGWQSSIQWTRDV